MARTTNLVGWSAAVAIFAVQVFAPASAEATDFTLNVADPMSDAANSLFETYGMTPERTVLSLGRLQPSMFRMPDRGGSIEVTAEEGAAAPESSSAGDTSFAPQGSPGSYFASGIDQNGLPTNSEGFGQLGAPGGEQATLELGGYRVSADMSSEAQNLFAEAMQFDQATGSVSPDGTPTANDIREVGPQVALPVDAEFKGSVAFSKLGVPVVSSSRAGAGPATGNIFLTAPNNELITLDPRDSSISMLDLLGGDNIALDARHAMTALEIRHVLVDTRDSLAELRDMLDSVSSIAMIRGTADQLSSAHRGPLADSLPTSDYEASPAPPGDSHSRFSNKMVHAIATISIAIRDYFWVLLVIYLIGMTLRWAMKRH